MIFHKSHKVIITDHIIGLFIIIFAESKVLYSAYKVCKELNFDNLNLVLDLFKENFFDDLVLTFIFTVLRIVEFDAADCAARSMVEQR